MFFVLGILLIFVLFLPVLCDKERLGHCCRCRRLIIDRDETEQTEIQSNKIEESVAFRANISEDF